MIIIPIIPIIPIIHRAIVLVSLTLSKSSFQDDTIRYPFTVRHDLQGISSDLKWSAVELSRIAARLEASGNFSDAQALLRMIQVFHQGEAQLTHIADELKAGTVTPVTR